VAVKLILRENVDHLGVQGEIVAVAPGYARNFLLPKGLALMATPGNLKMLEHKRQIWAEREMKEVDAAKALGERLSALELSIEKKAGEKQTLFGSVTNGDVAQLLANQGIELDRRQILLKDPIKSLGSHEVSIKLHSRVTAQVRVQVVPESADEARADPPAEQAAE